MAKIVLLNGIGSAGKSSLARAILAAASDIFLHVPMDYWLEMMPQRTLGTPEGLTFTLDANGLVTGITSGPEQERALRGMRKAVAAMADEGCNMVVDEVIFDPAVVAEYRVLLAAHDLHVVGVHAPLDVLEAREKARGDRAIGLSRSQFGVVHKDVAYDLEIDTTMGSPDDCARVVVERFGL
ncbi:MAG TPA: AAA family ATPase [Rhizomicrobium sp.]|nr:AAA family ATPase [Rhizomicrobium sp.]